MAKVKDALTIASHEQLQAALRGQLRHSEVQNKAMTNIVKRIGAAGKLIEEIKSLQDSESYLSGDMDRKFSHLDKFYTKVNALITTFESGGERASKGTKRGSK